MSRRRTRLRGLSLTGSREGSNCQRRGSDWSAKRTRCTWDGRQGGTSPCGGARPAGRKHDHADSK
jgi:hypothetical protein